MRIPAGPPRNGDRSPSRRRIPSGVKRPEQPRNIARLQADAPSGEDFADCRAFCRRHSIASWVGGMRVFRRWRPQNGDQIGGANRPCRAVWSLALGCWWLRELPAAPRQTMGCRGESMQGSARQKRKAAFAWTVSTPSSHSTTMDRWNPPAGRTG